MKTGLKALAMSPIGIVLLGVLVFLPAGTFNYWQGWVFIAVFTIATVIPTLYFARMNPAALQRRMHGGPLAEARTIQKFVVTGMFLTLFGMLLLSVFDHRMGWSSVPAWVSLLGDALLAAGLGVSMLVVKQNGYAAGTVTVETGQQVASGGVYKLVRHPMYVAGIIMMLGIPLALGSYWGLLLVIPGVVLVIFRILDEEKMLTQELGGYREYTQRVRYRLVPHVW